MTRGKIIFVDESGTLSSSVEFNGDMYPDGTFANGGRVIRAFKKGEIRTEEEYREYVYEFDKANFGYAENYKIDLIQDVFELENLEYDVRKNTSDYLYIINQSGHDIRILTEGDEKHTISDGDMGIVCYQSWEKIVKSEVPAEKGKAQENPAEGFYKQIIIARKDLHMTPGKLARSAVMLLWHF